jgi:hypothetical protein
MANLVMPYLIKVEVHVTEEIYEQDYPSNLQANKICVNVWSTADQKGHLNTISTQGHGMHPPGSSIKLAFLV